MNKGRTWYIFFKKKHHIYFMKFKLLVLLGLFFGTSLFQALTVQAAYEYSSQFGTEGNGNGEFDSPKDITRDSSGNIYVADTSNSRIQKFNSSGVYQSQFGSNGTGNGQFQLPNAIAIDSLGNIYVADTSNNRIQKFNSSGVYQSQFGSNGTGNGEFDTPRGIVFDSQGNILVVDRGNNRIQKFNSSGVYQSQFGSSGTGNGGFYNPEHMAIDSLGNIYVADRFNHIVQKFNSSGVYQSQFGIPGASDGYLSEPHSVMIDSSDRLYVADTNNNRIQIFIDPDFSLDEEAEEDSSRPAITSVSLSLSQTKSSCPTKLKVKIRGKRFTNDTIVTLGSKEASTVNRRSSKELVTSFCLKDFSTKSESLKKTLSVKNPGAKSFKARHKVNLTLAQLLADPLTSFDPDTRSGVINIQKVLVSEKLLSDKDVIGVYGPKTVAAVKIFQGKYGIPQTGVVGPRTIQAFRELL